MPIAKVSRRHSAPRNAASRIAESIGEKRAAVKGDSSRRPGEAGCVKSLTLNLRVEILSGFRRREGQLYS
jgi:hypothetical protein